MRRHCLECVYKHLADAAVAELEYHLGYPKFKLWVTGHLDHASQEAFKINPKLAWALRQHRLNWFAQPHTYDVPYEDLAGYVDICLSLISDAVDRDEIADQVVDRLPIIPEIPESCLEGIGRAGDGTPLFDMDTRP